MYQRRWETIKQAARHAGRAPEAIDATLVIDTSVTDTTKEAHPYLEMIKSIIVPSALNEAGYAIEFPEHLQAYSYMDWQPTEAYMEILAEYGQHVPTEAVTDFCLMGPPRVCIDRIEEFITAGVRHFIFEFMGLDNRKQMERCGQEILPHFTD